MKVFKALKSSKVLVIIEPPALIFHRSVSLLPSIICPIMAFFLFVLQPLKLIEGGKIKPAAWFTVIQSSTFAQTRGCTLTFRRINNGESHISEPAKLPSSLSVPLLYFASFWAGWFVVQPRWKHEFPCSLSVGYEICWDEISSHLGCHQRNRIPPPPSLWRDWSWPQSWRFPLFCSRFS